MTTAMTVPETFFTTRGGFAAYQIGYLQNRADGVECTYSSADQIYPRRRLGGSTETRNLKPLP